MARSISTLNYLIGCCQNRMAELDSECNEMRTKIQRLQELRGYFSDVNSTFSELQTSKVNAMSGLLDRDYSDILSSVFKAHFAVLQTFTTCEPHNFACREINEVLSRIDSLTGDVQDSLNSSTEEYNNTSSNLDDLNSELEEAEEEAREEAEREAEEAAREAEEASQNDD